MVPHRSVKSAPRTARGIKPVLSSAMTNEFGKKLMVAFDGSAINFDVEPRVEAGIPLAPFRQIFEHTGGQVMWAADAKTVRALNADREVIIKVGSPSATVNGQSVSMERTSYIDRGRTIVPLSCVGRSRYRQVNHHQQEVSFSPTPALRPPPGDPFGTDR